MCLASVIIPTFEDWDRLQFCLDRLAEQSLDQDQFEVIVANNNRNPTAPPALRVSGNTRIVHVPKPGSYAARNVAIGEAKADILFFTDSDCQPDPRWIEAGLAAVAVLGPYGRVAGRIEMFAEGDKWTGAGLYDRLFGLQQEVYAAKGWCATANLVARRAAFDLAGLFTDDRFSNGDREWGVRAKALGAELVFSRETVIRHPARSSFAELAKKRRRLAGGRLYGELQGQTCRKPLVEHLTSLTRRKLVDACFSEELTETERLSVLWVGFRLTVIEFLELARLRYLRGRPKRS